MSRLYLTEDAPVPGTECLQCGSLFGGAPERCDYCSGPVRRVSLGEEAVRFVLRHPPCGTTFVPASEHWLTELGGMSALLRS